MQIKKLMKKFKKKKKITSDNCANKTITSDNNANTIIIRKRKNNVNIVIEKSICNNSVNKLKQD